MDSILKDCIKTVTSGETVHPGFSERVLDKKAFASLIKEADEARAKAEPNKVLATYKALSSSFGGVAELQNIEANFELLNIYRDSLPMDIAEMRPLPLGTLPIFRYRTEYPFNVTVGSLSGMGQTSYWATSDGGQTVRPVQINVEEVMVPNLNNIYDMEKLEQRTTAIKRQEHDLQIAINNAVVNTVFSNPQSVSVLDDPLVSIQNYASNGGSFAGKLVYKLDPGVRPNAIPSVNYYDLSSTENGLTKKVFQTINTHSMKIGRNFPRMFIPQANTSGRAPVWEALQDMATPVALITGTVGTPDPAYAVPAEMWAQFQKEDFRGAVVVDWFGLRVAISKQNWLPEGYLVLFSDVPSCIMWDRLDVGGNGMDEGTVETPVSGFYSRRFRGKQIALARPDFALKNFLLVRVNA